MTGMQTARCATAPVLDAIAVGKVGGGACACARTFTAAGG